LGEAAEGGVVVAGAEVVEAGGVELAAGVLQGVTTPSVLPRLLP